MALSGLKTKHEERNIFFQQLIYQAFDNQARQGGRDRNLWKKFIECTSWIPRSRCEKKKTTTTGYEIPDDDWRAKPLLISHGREIFASRKLHARRVEQRIKGRAGEINFQRNLIRRGIKKKKKKKEKTRAKNQTTQQKRLETETTERRREREREKARQLVHLVMVKAIKSSLTTAERLKTRFEMEKLFRKCINAVVRLDKLAWQHRNCRSALWLVIDFSPEIGSLDHVIALHRPLINIIRPTSQLSIHRQNETNLIFESWEYLGIPWPSHDDASRLPPLIA